MCEGRNVRINILKKIREGKMDNIPNRLSSEASALIASASQSSRFKEKDVRKADAITKASEAVYFSPVIRIDAETSAAIIQYRDSETGAVKNEYPSPKQVEQYSKAPETTPEETVVEKKPAEEVL